MNKFTFDTLSLVIFILCVAIFSSCAGGILIQHYDWKEAIKQGVGHYEANPETGSISFHYGN